MSQRVSVRALGVSIAICSHNGEKRVARVLHHLKAQQMAEVPWEVILIDNASTDKTADVARECWQPDSPPRLRIVSEPRLGLSYARVRAFNEARYELVSFIDDDNWVAPDWVNVASRAMSADSSLGAILSVNRPIADGPLPQWFQRYCGHYAAWAAGDCPPPPPPHILIGAGMTIRKAALAQMLSGGFRPLATGRTGRRLSSSEDVELGYALMLAGWKIRLEPDLRLQHHLAPDRLKWSYCRRLLRTQEESNVVLDSYFWVSKHAPGLKNRLRERWWWHFVAEALALMRYHSISKLVSAYMRDMENDGEIIDIEKRIGRLIGFARLRSRYRGARLSVACARWRRRDSFSISSAAQCGNAPRAHER
jgi:glycosyltransferase involved in cell wall biosynthesis